ncbi:fanconi-associated nuclease 1 homolog isoform X2 [Impatiens glandulifera]|uniref:fanconi-associated nuclease 1 homolog isoform X2 n=1 Tax=Impatiens glandulifera TaxID=253017 RepID=UPI001FB17E78|nr:fanconi-associated nuclease 1 homolog isoform X2 [Impatiens glandulifera]
MLKGRESLIRLVGRRRRFLPNRQSILESIKDSLVTSGDDNNFEVAKAEEESAVQISRREVETPADSDWVNCPVCGSRFRGGDDVINSHLDICLKRGTKRKLSQPTLLQLNFCSRLENGSHSSIKDIVDTKRSIANVECDTVLESIVSCNAMESSDMPSSSLSNDSLRATAPSDNFSSNAECSVSLNNEIQDHKSAIKDGDDILSLETFIVGRRFSNEVEPNTGETIKLLRDPHNVKDCNAIKVLTGDPGYGEFLGFIPRELAQYLSPLMDKYSLIFQGCIIAKPASLSDDIPVQIMCQKCTRETQDSGNVQVFESLWSSACSVAESAKNHIPKYLHNFMLLIEEVLKSSAYLFSSYEKSFLENFFSLSDDSRKLFIRLYTRKGPWFRILHISYPEISDYAQAVKELSEVGYFCLVESINELQDDHLKGILNVLTVSELREIFQASKKKCSFGKRKQDLIELLLALHADGSCPLFLEVVLGKVGSCVQISSLAESLIWRAERLFFLNGEQDLSAFLLADLGIVKYPTYNCIITGQIISSRADFLSFEEAIEVAQIIDEALDENNSKLVLRCIEISDSRITTNCPNSISESKSTWVTYFKAPWIYSKVVFLGVSFLERERRYSEATNLLKRLLLNFTSDRRRGYWTLRLSIDLGHLGYIDESLSVAENAIQDPWVRAGSKMTLQRRILRLGKPPRRWKTPSFAGTVNRKINEAVICMCGIFFQFDIINFHQIRSTYKEGH